MANNRLWTDIVADISVKAHFSNITLGELKRWGRFCHVVYPLDFALRATTQHIGKAGELQILCCQGFEVNGYNFTLDAWALKPSGFCNAKA
jgi:hypothetical protein